MKAISLPRPTARLPAYALYGAILSGAGLPIYIYAPKFFADTYGVSLSLLGTILFALRLVDVVQDPALGWVAERLGKGRPMALAGGAALLAASMIGLFAVAPPVAPALWFAVTITGLFTAFSFLTINFYAQGVSKAVGLPGGHVQLAAWRESGALMGVCLAAIAPNLLGGVSAAPYAIFAWGFAAVTAAAALAMAPEWSARVRTEPTPIIHILKDGLARRLLILALVNAAPLAVTQPVTFLQLIWATAVGVIGAPHRNRAVSFMPASSTNTLRRSPASRSRASSSGQGPMCPSRTSSAARSGAPSSPSSARPSRRTDRWTASASTSTAPW